MNVTFFENWRCWFRHDWRYHMVNLSNHGDALKPVTFGWKQCDRCAHSKVTLIVW